MEKLQQISLSANLQIVCMQSNENFALQKTAIPKITFIDTIKADFRIQINFCYFFTALAQIAINAAKENELTKSRRFHTFYF